MKPSVKYWPDKASFHYSKKVLDLLESQQIEVVPKKDNPTNLPQCRPIEQAHTIIKRAVFKDDFKSKKAQELITRIHTVMAERESLFINFTMDSAKRFEPSQTL